MYPLKTLLLLFTLKLTLPSIDGACVDDDNFAWDGGLGVGEMTCQDLSDLTNSDRLKECAMNGVSGLNTQYYPDRYLVQNMC